MITYISSIILFLAFGCYFLPPIQPFAPVLMIGALSIALGPVLPGLKKMPLRVPLIFLLALSCIAVLNVPNLITMAASIGPVLYMCLLAMILVLFSPVIRLSLGITVNVLFIVFFPGEPVFLFSMLWFIYELYEKFHPTKSKVIRKRYFFACYLFLLLGVAIFLKTPELVISTKFFGFFIVWLLLQLAIPLQNIQRKKTLFITIMMFTVFLTGSEKLLNMDLFWLFWMLVMRAEPISESRRPFKYVNLGVISFCLLCSWYLTLGPFLQSLYLKDMKITKKTYKKQFKKSRYMAYLSADTYLFWIDTVRQMAISTNDPDLKQKTTSYCQKLLNLEPVAKYYLLAARSMKEINYDHKAYKYYLESSEILVRDRDELMEFILFLEGHPYYENVDLLLDKYVRIGYKCYPEDQTIADMMNKLRKDIGK